MLVKAFWKNGVARRICLRVQRKSALLWPRYLEISNKVRLRLEVQVAAAAKIDEQ